MSGERDRELLSQAADPERVKDEYFFAASDYYAAGRFAFWTRSYSVCGNLLHHAIEFSLKGHLWPTLTPEVLEKDLRHELHRIWNRFKKVATDSRLATFERTIQDIDRFEELRYPDKMFTKKGPLLFQFELRRIDLDNVLALDKTLGTKRPARSYVLAMEEVDQLVVLLFDVCSRDPARFLPGLVPGSPERMKYITLSNSAWTGATP